MKADLVIRNGVVVDGTGTPGRLGDVAVLGDRIVAVGEVPAGIAPELDASGAVVAPGFINILSQAYESLQRDPRGLSDLYQGVTTEVFGEGYSVGPVRGRMAEHAADLERRTGVRHTWPSARGFLEWLEEGGVGPNVATFVGADNLRIAFAGMERRPLTEDEIASACELLDDELAAGALGLGSALIYAPGDYASTHELIAFSRVAAAHDALYISHIRSEADHLPAAVEELIRIARKSGARAEIYHVKAAGRRNWPLLGRVLDRIDDVRAEGLEITGDVYPYEAGATGLDACIPSRYHEGGAAALRARLADPETRAEIRDAIARPGVDWENPYVDTGGPEGILLLGGATSHYNGRTIAEVASERGADPIQTLLDIVVEDSEMIVALFEMTEDNVHLALERPWVSVCSDSEAWTAEPPFSDVPTHPRAYGSFARVVGPYVRAGRLTLEDAVHRMSGLPASVLRLADRGVLREGAFADVCVFDAARIQDLATYSDPHRYAVGMQHVLINGVVAFRDGRPTDALPGRALRRSGTRAI